MFEREELGKDVLFQAVYIQPKYFFLRNHYTNRSLAKCKHDVIFNFCLATASVVMVVLRV